MDKSSVIDKPLVNNPEPTFYPNDEQDPEGGAAIAHLWGEETQLDDKVWVLRCVHDGRYACYQYQHKYSGLAVFTKKEFCGPFIAASKGVLQGFVALEVGIDDARTIAKLTPIGVNGEIVVCLIVCDNLSRLNVMWLDNVTNDDLNDGD